MEPKWRLGEDMVTRDNILDGVTFDDLILAVHCNCKVVSRAAVYSTLAEILSQRKQDMMYLVEKNMDVIIQKALEGREQE